MKEKICEICENSFLARNTQVGKYCSKKCRGIGINKPIPIKDRVYNFIDKRDNNNCWNYLGFKNADGYGIIGTSKGKTEGAHRAVYKIEKGNIPKNCVIMHICDNPSCCNPNHLFLGTQNDNIKDMVKKGRNIKLTKESCSKFTIEIINEIRESYTNKRGEKFQLSKKYNCSPSTITNILNNWE